MMKNGNFSKIEEGPQEDDGPEEIETLFRRDGYLRSHEADIRKRHSLYMKTLRQIIDSEGSLELFADSYNSYGCHVDEHGTFSMLQWAPNAQAMWLMGDFNEWNPNEFGCTKMEFGKWCLKIPPKADGICAVPHLSRLKLVIQCLNGEIIYRLDPWATYVKPPENGSTIYNHHFWNPSQIYQRMTVHPEKPASLRIYECHIGISSVQPIVNSYERFSLDVLPRIKRLGYNAIQVMAVMEHAYYASFGYQVTSFFAASSRYGTPDELKHMIDRAHNLGLYVMLDVVHSHACKNTEDGLNMFDGTDSCYFHSGSRGNHDLWDSRLFNYTEWEVLRFLLSNLRMWMDVFGFDGFRFDGITSMLYLSRGIGQGFSGDYNEYFGENSDVDALVYLMLANHLLHSLSSNMITIAEDVSGMPALCRPIVEGGTGFDYRLSMAIPDMWIKILKEISDEDWDLNYIVHTLCNRRWQEKCVAYAESHDQALVGDKTLAFWLMDKEMYTGMSSLFPMNCVIERGIALHKMIRFLVHGLGGEAYLNFIGNEFGHPEWLDFPRSGNNDSYHYCRRQWNLVDDPDLRYRFLNAFDASLNKCEALYGWLRASDTGYVSTKHESDKVIVFERANCLFVFNFHSQKSFTDYKVGVEIAGTYRVVLDTDSVDFGGQGRLKLGTEHHTFPETFANRQNHMFLYIPCRSAFLLAQE